MNNTKLMFLLLASLVLGACGGSDGDDSNGGGGNGKNAPYTETTLGEAPSWQVDWTNNQAIPNWTTPDFSEIYENWTIIKVKMEDELAPYVSKDDMMALFVNGELRGLANPAVDISTDKMIEGGKFVMKVWGNETGNETVNMSLQYYSQRLKHLFTLNDDITLDPDKTVGIDKEYVPEFTMGSAKYSVKKTVGVESLLTKVGLTPVSGNIVGAFVGDECRGVATLSVSGFTPLDIYGRNTGEAVTLRYYDVASYILYTLTDPVKI